MNREAHDATSPEPWENSGNIATNSQPSSDGLDRISQKQESPKKAILSIEKYHRLFSTRPQSERLGGLSGKLIEQFDMLIRRDPGRRGLIAAEAERGPLCAGHLAEAADHLSRHARCVGLVTGFFVPHGDPPAAETDGPLGTLVLAAALEAVGIQTVVLTDEHCYRAVTCAAEALSFSTERITLYPRASDAWIEAFFESGPGSKLSHMIAVERAGPSHTRDSLAKQHRSGPAPLDEFLLQVPAESHGRCHNMWGQVIDEHTADMHRLFEEVHSRRPHVRTIGIGDGGNEIGMGAIPWEELRRRLDNEHAARIPCRVSTDWTIVAGTSNWGAYALAAAALVLRRRVDVLRQWGRNRQQRALEHIVEHGPAIDGITGRREATVDGLPFVTYIQPWEGICRLLGFEE